MNSTTLDPRLAGVDMVVACDVDNPLLGPEGAARVFGPQKGASPEEVELLERGLLRFCQAACRCTSMRIESLPGAGAAGGMGAGLRAFCDADVRPGFDVVAEAVGLRQTIAGADLMVTGEGRLDGQTARGKAVAGAARLASELGVPAIAIVGRVADDAPPPEALGLRAVVACEGPAWASPAERLERAAETAAQLIGVGSGMKPRA